MILRTNDPSTKLSCNSTEQIKIHTQCMFRILQPDQGHSCENPRSGFKKLTIFRRGGICWIASNPVSNECFITKFY